jgi:hypothetical protein
MSGNKEYKRLLIVTGPQGSGNHLFSKVLGYHPYVSGWDFGDKYWIPSDEEPFAECWVDPSKTKSMLKGSAIVANVSVPFVYDGVKQVPKIQEVVNEAKNAGYDVKVCVVVREENINKEQQRRVRKEVTLPTALNYYYNLDADLHFLSHESLYLYGGAYLKWLSKVLDFPIAYDDERINETISENQNEKYVKHVDTHWLDEQVWNGIRPKNER